VVTAWSKTCQVSTLFSLWFQIMALDTILLNRSEWINSKCIRNVSNFYEIGHIPWLILTILQISTLLTEKKQHTETKDYSLVQDDSSRNLVHATC
jgi:hypothetical protein